MPPGRPKGAKNKPTLTIKLLKEQLIKNLVKSRGLIGPAIQNLDSVDRTRVNKWLKEDANFAKQCYDIREMSFDKVESKLLEMCDEKNISAIKFFLSCLAKQRGYTNIENQINIQNNSIVFQIGADQNQLPPTNEIKLIDNTKSDEDDTKWIDSKV